MKVRIDLKILFFLVLFKIKKQIELYTTILGFAFLHEIAHILIGILLKFKPREIEIMPFGFWATLEPKIYDYKRKVLRSNIVEVKYIFIAPNLKNFILKMMKMKKVTFLLRKKKILFWSVKE